jgi:RimJ/RimL family protein N-acetyltransferase
VTPGSGSGSGPRLEPLSAAHRGELEALVADPDVLRFTRVPEPAPADFVDMWLARYKAGRLDGTREAFAIVDQGGGFLGLALAPAIDVATSTVELGYVVAPHARGRGVATEALRLLTDWAFDERGALRIELVIGVANGASQVVAGRCGYRLEGVMRSVEFKPGVREDVQLWSLLPGDR